MTMQRADGNRQDSPKARGSGARRSVRLARQRPGIYYDGRAALAAMRRGEVTSRALVEACLAAIAEDNPEVNAVVMLDADAARIAADRADAVAAGDRRGPLHGLPVTIKESFDVAGWPSTFGDPALAERTAARHSVVAQRLIDAGAIILGKTNLPERLVDWETTNRLFGTTRNPHDLSRTAGGSSGGSAAAVAAGFSYIDVGSDGGGSIRLPAHCCGVYGLKPTWGIVPTLGHSASDEIRTPDALAAGPLARSARDVDLALSVLAGPEPERGVAWRLHLPRPRARRIEDLRIAAILDHPACPIDSPYAEALAAMVKRLRRRGASVELARPLHVDLERMNLLFNLLVRAETSTALDDDAFGTRMEIAGNANVDATPEERVNARGAVLRHRDWLLLHEERLRIGLAWQEFILGYDVLICPAAAGGAPPLDTRGSVAQRTIPVNGRDLPIVAQHFWYALASLNGLPSLAAPIGQVAGGLPVGVQLIGPCHADRNLVAIARLLFEPARRAPLSPPAVGAVARRTKGFDR